MNCLCIQYQAPEEAAPSGAESGMLAEARQKLKQQNDLLKRLAHECTRLKQQLADAEAAHQSAHELVIQLDVPASAETELALKAIVIA